MPRREHVQRPKSSPHKPPQAPNAGVFENDLFPLKAKPNSEAVDGGIPPNTLNTRAVLQLQRMIGNQAVMRLVQHTGASNTMQRDGGGASLVVSRPKPKPKEAVVEVTPEEEPDGGEPDADGGEPAPEAEAPEAEEEELTEEGLLAEIEADKESAAKWNAEMEAKIAALPDKVELTAEEEYEQMVAELEASGEMEKPSPEDEEFAALEAEFDKDPNNKDLGDVPLEKEDIDSEIEAIKAELTASAAFSTTMGQHIKDSAKAIQDAYKGYDALMDGIANIDEMWSVGFAEAADAYIEEVESQQAQIEEWEELLLETKEQMEASQARLAELLAKKEEIAPTRTFSYGTRAKAKKAAKYALTAAAIVAPFLKPITTAIGIVRDVVAVVKTLRHIHNLGKIGRNKSMNPKTREALSYVLGKKKTKAGRKGASAAQLGKAVKVYTGLKSLYKRAKGTKGKNREKFAKVLHTQAQQGDADANAIILELVGTGNIEETMRDSGWKIIMDKMKST